jgi:hypothetical protein
MASVMGREQRQRQKRRVAAEAAAAGAPMPVPRAAAGGGGGGDQAAAPAAGGASDDDNEIVITAELELDQVRECVRVRAERKRARRSATLGQRVVRGAGHTSRSLVPWCGQARCRIAPACSDSVGGCGSKAHVHAGSAL